MGLVGRYTSEIRINWVSLLTAKEGRGFCEVKGGFRREGIRRGEAKKPARLAGDYFSENLSRRRRPGSESFTPSMNAMDAPPYPRIWRCCITHGKCGFSARWEANERGGWPVEMGE